MPLSAGFRMKWLSPEEKSDHRSVVASTCREDSHQIVKAKLSMLYANHRDKVMYLVVGVWNTIFQYTVFSLCYWLLHASISPSAIVLISYFVGSVNGFFCMRHFVFGPQAHPLKEYLKFQVVYGPLLILNMIVLPLVLKYSSLNAYVTQALFVGFVVVAGYAGNKYFTFRKSSPADGGAEQGGAGASDRGEIVESSRTGGRTNGSV
jgi:putative flippase GtrA